MHMQKLKKQINYSIAQIDKPLKVSHFIFLAILYNIPVCIYQTFLFIPYLFLNPYFYLLLLFSIFLLFLLPALVTHLKLNVSNVNIQVYDSWTGANNNLGSKFLYKYFVKMNMFCKLFIYRSRSSQGNHSYKLCRA